MYRIVSLVLLAMLAACVTPPTQEQMQADGSGPLPREPGAGQGMIYVVRPSPVGGMIRFNVFLNDQDEGSEMGFTRGGQYIYFAVPPGKHRVYSKAENWAEIDVSVADGQVVFLQQDAAVGVLMARNSIAELEAGQGRYYARTLALGTVLKAAARGTSVAKPGAAGAPPSAGGGPVKLDDLEGLLPK